MRKGVQIIGTAAFYFANSLTDNPPVFGNPVKDIAGVGVSATNYKFSNRTGSTCTYKPQDCDVTHIAARYKDEPLQPTALSVLPAAIRVDSV
jgi:hypothetical protein